MSVYVIQRECGDYYCGCGGGHIVGVYEGPVDAELAVKDAEAGIGYPCHKITEVAFDEYRWEPEGWQNNNYTHGWT